MSKFYLPIGQPSSALTETQRVTYLQAFLAAFSMSDTPFDLQNLLRSFTLAQNHNNPGYKNLFAIWDGIATRVDDLVKIEMSESLHQSLKQKWFREYPVPKYAIYGPVSVGDLDIPKNVKQGELLAGLPDGKSFKIFFQDQHFNYLDPLFYFQLFSQEGLWDIPTAIKSPFLKHGQKYPLRVVRKLNSDQKGIYLQIKGGSKNTELINPPANIDSLLFSFLSNDSIAISIHGIVANNLQCKISDVSDEMYKTPKKPSHVTFPAQTAWKFNIETDLKPFHKQLEKPEKSKKSNGKDTPGKPLCYAIEVIQGEKVIRTTQIGQDIKDVIRQEYRFHDQPFQLEDTNLLIPERKQIEFNRFSSTNFSASSIHKNNYDTVQDYWIINGQETIDVLEFLQAEYNDNVLERKETHADEYTTVKTTRLTITSAWRNPERNEAVGGVKNSNHQYGRAMDIKSHYRGQSDNNKDNIGAFVSLMAAGEAFLRELVRLNGAAKATKVEILLENQGSALWRIFVDSNTLELEIKSQAGNKYSAHVKGTTEINLKQAAKFATHVHIGWQAKKVTEKLKLPKLTQTSRVITLST